MSVCARLKSYSKTHERIADFFSLLSVAMLFGTIWFVMQYYTHIVSWVMRDMILHLPLTFGALVLDVFFIFLFLNIGSSRFTEEGEEDGCFQTFRGRRTGSGSMFAAVTSWIQHMEHVSKKHR